MSGIVDIIWRAIFVCAPIAAFDVCANFIASSANILRCTFVDVLTRACIWTETISLRTFALIRAMRVLTNSHAKIRCFVNLTFVNVFARSIVVAQVETSVTCAAIWSPVIDTLLRAQARNIGAFVDISARFVIVSLSFEAFFAVASIAALCVYTLWITRTNLIEMEIFAIKNSFS